MTIVERARSWLRIDGGERLASLQPPVALDRILGMVEKAVATFSAGWLFLAPVLCAAGVLTHPCECSEGLKECGACCAGDEENGCDCVDQGCSHDGCDSDPCGATVRPEKDARTQVRGSLVESPVLGLLVLLHPDRPPAYGRRTAACSGSSRSTRNLPYPPSDLPLRV